MQAQPAHKGGALFLETVHADYLSELDGDRLDAPLNCRTRDTEALGYRLVGITADDGTQHLNRLQCVFVVLADLLAVLHDLLLPSTVDRHLSEYSSADAPIARRNRRERCGISSSDQERHAR